MKLADDIKSLVALTLISKHKAAAIDRVLAYSALEPEPGYNRAVKPEDWPRNGSMSIRVSDSNTHISNVLSGEKVGIVGKNKMEVSSFLEELYRLRSSKPESTIFIDGINTDHLNIQLARSALAHIPSAPFLFQGSVRLNLDPGDEYDDTQLTEVLEKVKLKQLLEARLKTETRGLLYTSLASDGVSLSAVERQLLYLARAILRGNKIIVYEEANARKYEDHKTKEILEHAITDFLNNQIVLVFARCPNSVFALDKVLVLENGRVVESGVPSALREAPNSRFSKLLEHYTFNISVNL